MVSNVSFISSRGDILTATNGSVLFYNLFSHRQGGGRGPGAHRLVPEGSGLSAQLRALAEPSVPRLTTPTTVIVIVTATITTAASAQHLHLHCPDHFLLVFTVLAILYGFTYFILIILFDVSAFYREH